YKNTILRNNIAFRAVQARFLQYRNTYSASSQTAAIRANVSLMDDIILAFNEFLAPPPDSASVTPELASSYDNLCILILSKLGEISINRDATFAGLKTDVTKFVES